MLAARPTPHASAGPSRLHAAPRVSSSRLPGHDGAVLHGQRLYGQRGATTPTAHRRAGYATYSEEAAAAAAEAEQLPSPPLLVGRRGCMAGLCACCICSTRGAIASPSSAAQQQPQQAAASWSQRLFAKSMDVVSGQYEAAIRPVKAQLFAEALDPRYGVRSLLEVGIGTGPNLAYYAAAAAAAAGAEGAGAEGAGAGGALRVTGVDPNPAMAPYAHRAAQAAGVELTVLAAPGEAMPLGTGSVDLAVCTLVLCSVPSQARVLAEVRRVLRPGGAFVFIEHVLAPPGRPGLRAQQRLLDPLQGLVAGGCSLTRDTLASIEAAGFSRLEARQFDLEGLWILGPHIVGVATA